MQRNHSGGIDQAFAIRWSDVDTDALAAALDDLRARHEPLRDPDAVPGQLAAAGCSS